MRKKLSTITLVTIMMISTVGCSIQNNGNIDGQSKVNEGTFYSCTAFSNDDTSFEISLSANAVISVGDEDWVKGEKVTITFDEYDGTADLTIALISVPEDKITDEEINIDEQAVTLKADEKCEVTLTSPADGKYGVKFINNSDEKITFTGYTSARIQQVPESLHHN